MVGMPYHRHMHLYMNCCGGEPQEALAQAINQQHCADLYSCAFITGYVRCFKCQKRDYRFFFGA